METKTNALKASWLHLTLLAFVVSLTASECTKSNSLLITRQNNGDIFAQVPINADRDAVKKCTAETCVGISSGTATAVSERDMCSCQCHSHLPALREDLKICVDDIHVRTKEHKYNIKKRNIDKSKLAEHILTEDGQHMAEWNNIKIIGKEDNNQKRKIKESACILLNGDNSIASCSVDIDRTWYSLLKSEHENECVLAPFVGGSTSQHIPFVYLPLKGQIIHPGKAIALSGMQKPVCAVSGSRYMTEDGWVDLRNPVDSGVPFRLIKDDGRTFLQWNGEPDLRNRMSGRLVLVNLMCREMSMIEATDIPRVQMIFSPCVAFRIVGTPAKQMSNVSEVAFVQDSTAEANNKENDSMSVPEYIAIGICSVLLGLIYVASVFLYLHLRKRNKSNSIATDDKSIREIEEGIVKSNPLLSLTSNFIQNDQGYSDENSSDNDAPDIIKHFEDRKKHITSALVHPQQLSFNPHRSTFSSFEQPSHQDSATNERLPEENVSITETLENREDRPDNLKALTGSTRKKLYFNPAYFDPQLLLTPPPAAIEFLTKIREVISIAKQKLTTKRFTPSLLNIPEEESHYPLDNIYGLTNPVSRRSSIISLKRVNSRRKTCTGCPGCEPQDLPSLTGILPEIPSLVACHSCTTSSNESKQNSIRKWLEDVPMLKDTFDQNHNEGNLKRVRSPTKSLPPESYNEVDSSRAQAPELIADRNSRSSSFHSSNKKEPGINRRIRKPNQPPPPPIKNIATKEENYYDTVPMDNSGVSLHGPPPDMIQEAMVIERSEEKIATLTKEQMNAVINEFTIHKNLISPVEVDNNAVADYETDSLERSGNKGYSTPSDYAEVSSSQPSPSLSTALPVQEEMTIRNAIINRKTRDLAQSNNLADEDEHDYELIVMKKESQPYNLPKFLQTNSGYSLVSEVYVNSGYNYSSAPSTPGGSRYSTLDKKELKVRYEEGPEKPGKLLIEVEDCADHYIPVHESDEYEPDTLERNPSKIKRNNEKNFDDSLERSDQIILRSTGSFRSDTVSQRDGNFNRTFGSLREIYEAKTGGRRNEERDVYCMMSDEEKGRILTLEERHSRRQRSRENLVQPDVIPPPPHDNSPIYQQPKPPRRVAGLDNFMKPPMPPKNGNGRSVNLSTSNVADRQSYISSDTPDQISDYQLLRLLQKSTKTTMADIIQTENIVLQKDSNDHLILHYALFSNPRFDQNPKKPLRSWRKTLKPEDSGYLSSDSCESRLLKRKDQATDQAEVGSETDESLGDGHSESGAESVETHSVFFGRVPSIRGNFRGYGSMDSGVMGGEDGHSGSDSETVSRTTVVPVTITAGLPPT